MWGPVLSVQLHVQFLWLGKACVKQIPELWQVMNPMQMLISENCVEFTYLDDAAVGFGLEVLYSPNLGTEVPLNVDKLNKWTGACGKISWAQIFDTRDNLLPLWKVPRPQYSINPIILNISLFIVTNINFWTFILESIVQSL